MSLWCWVWRQNFSLHSFLINLAIKPGDLYLKLKLTPHIWKYSQYWTQLALGAGIYSAEDIQTPGPKGQEIKQTVKEDFSRFTAWELKTNLCEIKSCTITDKDPKGSSQWLWNFNLRVGSFRTLVHNFRVEIYYQTLNIQTITQSAQYNVSTLYTIGGSVDECSWHVFSSKDWWELAVELWVCT